MATELLMPKLGLTMTEGTIDEWKVKVGDEIHKGDIIYSVATDKLTNDVEADADGFLLKIGNTDTETAAKLRRALATVVDGFREKLDESR